MKHITRLVVLVVLLSSPAAGQGESRLADAPKTIAVLDFVNRNPADGRDWLGKGLADMVMTDLAASRRLGVVDRERVQDLMREINLGTTGILDPETAPKVGQIAKVDWVLFGTFLYDADNVSIEAMLIDVNTGQMARIEQVEGPANKLFHLEEKLVNAILAKLDVPMTEEERRVVKLLKTQSLPAFEHYARSLDRFDKGQWFDALREARLARRADPAYFAAAVRVARLYYDVGEPEHAVIEYRRFVEQDRDGKLPDDVYFTLGKILEQTFADRAGAINVFQRLLRRDSRYDQPFCITDPSRTSHGWDDVGKITDVDALFQKHKASLEALEQLARWQLEVGEQLEAARLYGQLWQWLNAHGMPLGAGRVGTGFHAKVLQAYGPLYWHLVLENKDAKFYPPCSVNLLPTEGATVGPDTAPTHGHYKWQNGQVWLAPPDWEIAEVEYALEDDGSGRRKLPGGKVGIDFQCAGYISILMKQPQVKPDGAWHTFKLKPGIRALRTHPFTKRWRMKLKLRPWTRLAKVPEVGSFQVNLLPEGAKFYLNGKSRGHVTQGLAFVNKRTGQYQIEARWPDGRRRAATFEILKGHRGGMLLHADLDVLSRQVLAPQGSNTCLLTDRTGRIWLLWDQVCLDRWGHFNLESDLLCATSIDGIHWSRPRRLPVSSLECDTTPILRQDRRGVFWLVWVSSRDPKDPKAVWIASSPNGIEWSFPQKIALPETEENDPARWRETPLPRPAFAIDARNVFWLVWQGWLLRSEDAQHWAVDSLLRTSDKEYGADNVCNGKSHCLLSSDDGLLMTANYYSKDHSQFGPRLWRRGNDQRWERLGPLGKKSNFVFEPSSVATSEHDTILTVAQENSGLWFRKFMADGSKSQPLCVESHLTDPIHPSVVPLANGRFLVAFGSKYGLVATVLQPDKAATGAKIGKTVDTEKAKGETTR